MRYFILLCLIVSTGACSAMRTLERNYMDADSYNQELWHDAATDLKRHYLGFDDYDRTDWPEALEVLQRDYLNANQTFLGKRRLKSIVLIAQDSFLRSPYKDQFDVANPVVDEAPAMREAFDFHFIHFLPIEGNLNVENMTYMVVVDRFRRQILHTDLFTKPKGDPYYRYHDIIKQLIHRK